jgi:AbrB family looped-hinge helix DNA binding protein
MGTKGTGTAKLLADGRVTVPKPVREQLSLNRGDLVQIDVKPLEDS